jgi:hypothetical protein
MSAAIDQASEAPSANYEMAGFRTGLKTDDEVIAR